ncbi:hypothetical protein PHO31112_03892 [Pandoraea horticolens]|uniref:Cupin n=1 Tax=Pandoraea horticolens TaxID=2508298 RepID=A0A5E4XIM6_9BURK|nr:cupin domain-containing protein [Pandoraea horticolens]VVE36157.1 hypothetical protein PHO31112_03892 [Pandoraea horticolens]
MTTIRLSTPHARALRPLHNLRHPLLSPFLAGAALLIAAAAPAVADDRRAGISTETLAKSATAWDQTGYAAYPSGTPEPTLVRITLAPNTRLDWHTHPMPAIGYVASGHLTVERADNGAQRAFVAGQTVTELVDVPHRGWSSDAGAELLVFYAGSVHQPLFLVSPDTEKLAQDETVKTSRD